MTAWVGVDVGGTFTDVVSYDQDSGSFRIAKIVNAGEDIASNVIKAIEEISPTVSISVVQYFAHGTTVGLNTVLQRNGAKVGILCTRGFRDVLELRRSKRDEMYNLFWKPPAPLVPRWLRLPVKERIAADGTILTPLDPHDIEGALEQFSAEAVETIAVAFINSYVNPQHELQAERLLREQGFAGAISLSHRVSSEYREYERTATCLLDAYIKPRVVRYLGELEDALGAAAFRGQFLVTRSGGGAMTLEEAKARPFETIQSGPVAGVIGAGEICIELQLGEAITADVGGTSFDTSLIVNARPVVKYEGNVADLPVQTSWIDVRSVGAGGGSIAWVDSGGLLRVGPRSAGARPGPACYGWGGIEPTVTDAAVVLNILGHAPLAGGVQLDRSLALKAVKSVASPLGMEVVAAAQAIMTITTSSMANAIREVTIERGHDPRDAALIAFGGAGPLFCTLLARELEIARIVIPPYPGNFSAWGLLAQDLERTYSASLIAPLTDEALVRANSVAEDLFERLQSFHGGRDEGVLVREVSVDLRYVGQEYSLTIPVRAENGVITASLEEIGEAFRSEYERAYGHRLEAPLQLVAVRATLRIPISTLKLQVMQEEATDSMFCTPKHAQAFSFSMGRTVPFTLLTRDSINALGAISGPAIISEETAATYLDVDFQAVLHGSGSLIVTRRES